MGRTPFMRWVGSAELLASALDGKHPVDAGAIAIAAPLPVRDLRDQRGLVGDAAVEALPDHHADLDPVSVKIVAASRVVSWFALRGRVQGSGARWRLGASSACDEPSG